jgi:hypothetical protein
VVNALYGGKDQFFSSLRLWRAWSMQRRIQKLLTGGSRISVTCIAANPHPQSIIQSRFLLCAFFFFVCVHYWECAAKSSWNKHTVGRIVLVTTPKLFSVQVLCTRCLIFKLWVLNLNNLISFSRFFLAGYLTESAGFNQKRLNYEIGDIMWAVQ